MIHEYDVYVIKAHLTSHTGKFDAYIGKEHFYDKTLYNYITTDFGQAMKFITKEMADRYRKQRGFKYTRISKKKDWSIKND